jgi:hypothetical protein
MKQQNKAWLKQRAQAIRQKFPNATPAEVAAALEYGVKQESEMGGTEKMLLQSQVAELRAETSVHDTAMRVQGQEAVEDVRSQTQKEVAAARDDTLKEVAKIHGLTQVDVAKLNDAARVQAASMSAGARVQAAGIAAGGHVTAAQITAGARTLVAQMGGDEKEWEAQLKADVANYRTQAGGGATTAPAPARRPPPSMGGGGGGQTPSNVDPAKEKALALSHIRQGADAAKVRQIYQQRTGQPADF